VFVTCIDYVPWYPWLGGEYITVVVKNKKRNEKVVTSSVMLSWPNFKKCTKNNTVCSIPEVFLVQVLVQQRCHLDYPHLAALVPVSMQG